MKPPHTKLCSGPCVLRAPIQPGKYGLKLKVVLKWRDNDIENIIIFVSLLPFLKLAGIVNLSGFEFTPPPPPPLTHKYTNLPSCQSAGHLERSKAPPPADPT